MAWESESQTKQGFLLGQTRESSDINQLGVAHPGSCKSVYLPLVWLIPPLCVTLGQGYVWRVPSSQLPPSPGQDLPELPALTESFLLIAMGLK